MELPNTSFSRRRFLGTAAATSAVLGLAQVGAFPASPGLNIGLGRALAEGMGDLDVLNYALTLELFEAELYRVLNSLNLLTGKEAAYVREFGAAEASHAETLTGVIRQLGGTPVQRPAGGYSLPQVTTRGQVLNILVTVEEVGVGAYQGAAELISSRDLLTAAGGIMQVEARHAAVIRFLATADPGNPAGENPQEAAAVGVPSAFTKALTMAQVLENVRPFIPGL